MDKTVDDVFAAFVEQWDGPAFSNIVKNRRRCAFTDGDFRFFFGFVNRTESVPLKVQVDFGVEDIKIAKLISDAKGHNYTPMRYYLHSSTVVNFWRLGMRSKRCAATGWEFRKEEDWNPNINEMVIAGKFAYEKLLKEVSEADYIQQNNYFEVDKLSADNYRICGYSRDVSYTFFFDLLRRGETERMKEVLHLICSDDPIGWKDLCDYFYPKIAEYESRSRTNST